MRIALIHNPNSGERRYGGDELRRLLEVAGHDVIEVDRSEQAIRRAMESPHTRPEAFAVAGGDGTVATVARALSHPAIEIPLVVLPIGTANNIAASLGISGEPDEIVQTFSPQRRARLDVGEINAPWGRRNFVESAGVGFIGATLHGAETTSARIKRAVRSAGLPGNERTRRAAVGVSRLLRDHPARFCAVRADGAALDGLYLAVEAMIIRSIGPRVALAPRADPGDGAFDLVLVRPEHRSQLADYIASPGTREPPPLETRRATKILMSWSCSDGHVDDEPWPAANDRSRAEEFGDWARLTVVGSVDVLVPERSGLVAADAGRQSVEGAENLPVRSGDLL